MSEHVRMGSIECNLLTVHVVPFNQGPVSPLTFLLS